METAYFYQRKLRDALTERIERNPRYSLRAFSKSLGLDPATLSQLLSGKRFPSPKLAQKIFEGLDFSPEEQEAFLKSLAEAKSEKGLKRMSPKLRTLLQKAGENPFRPQELTLDVFKVAADWYHFAILELPFAKGFKSEPSWIARALGITVAEAHSAIQRLIALELLEIENGVLKRRHAQLRSGDRHLTSAAHRRRQKQILEKSIQSLEHDPIEERNHSAMTFAIDSRKIPEAKKRIEKFLSEMTEFLESGERDRVYEMTVNLFPIQKTKSETKTLENEYEVPKND